MITNKTQKTIIDQRFRICRTPFQKLMGLMFSSSPKTLVFEFNKERKESLHMFFVFFPIDVIFLDRDKKVVETLENFRPCRVYFPRKKAKYIIESKQGTIKRTKTILGDNIQF